MKERRLIEINFRQWIINPKNPAALFCLALYTYDLLHGMIDFANYLGCKITPWMLPFLLCSASRFLPVMLLFLLLVSDAPFCNRQQCFVMLRTGKRTWIVGQLLYLLLVSILFTILTWLFSWIWYSPVITWEKTWGNGLITACEGIDPSIFGVFLNFAYSMVKNSNPLAVTVWCSIVMVFVCYMLGVMITVCNLWLKRGVGVLIAAALVGISLIPEYFTIDPGIIKMTVWISPISWMDRVLMGHTAQNLPSYAFGIWAPGLISMILTAYIIFTIGKCNIDTGRE